MSLFPDGQLNLASSVCVWSADMPGDSKLWESPDEEDIVWRLFFQILFR